MGNFYVNFTTRGPNQAAVAACLRTAKRKSYVSPTRKAVSVFYDEDSDTQETAPILNVGKLASLELKAPVVAVLNHDDDVLLYWLFENGKLVDGYNSNPDYFAEVEGIPPSFDAKRLSVAFAAPDKAKQVGKILRDEEYVFALDRHKDLAALLNHPWPYVCLGYRYIHEGNFPAGIGKGDFLRVS